MPRILILEDERVVARDLEKVLVGIGYQISMTSSGEEAIDLARRERPDMALVDIHLAGKLDGIETAATLRRELDVGVIYLTAHSDEETLERAKVTEPYGYLVKPFEATTLQTTVQMAVNKEAAERRLQIEQRFQTTVLNQLTVGIVTADPAGKVTMVNGCGQALTGWSEREALGGGLAQVVRLAADGKTSTAAELLDRVLKSPEGEVLEGRANLVSRSGAGMWVEHRVSRVVDEGQQVVGVSVVFWPAETSGGKRAGPPVSNEPVIDPLTGLPDRATATAEIAQVAAKSPGVFAVLFVLNRYYLIARKYGTRTADSMLTYYGTILAQEIPECQGLYRWTGPCFLALIGPFDCLQAAQRSVSHLTYSRSARLFQPAGTSALLTVTGSVQVYSIEDKPLDILISQIDSYIAIDSKRLPEVSRS